MAPLRMPAMESTPSTGSLNVCQTSALHFLTNNKRIVPPIATWEKL